MYADFARDLDALDYIMVAARRWLDDPEPKGRMMNPDLLRRVADALDNPTIKAPWEPPVQPELN
jgi:hypothetical protein